jgi:predicted aminopeptidase
MNYLKLKLRHWARWQRAGLLLGLLGLLGVTGCADIHYVLQSVSGHLQVMQAASPMSQLLDDAHTSPRLKAQLLLAQRMRSFAVSALALPDNESYHRYADLGRRAVVWNVVAAPELSLKLKTWCFPVAGCVGYRGYFEEAQARAMAVELQAQGQEVSVYGVPAYSTLGWMNWAGGDPLLNTFIHYPEDELARMIFHELAHQVLYVPDDTVFNESFATAVANLGVARWLTAQGSQAAWRGFAAHSSQRAQFRALIVATRRTLSGIYEGKESSALDHQEQMAMKKRAMQEFRAQYLQLRVSWGAAPFPGWDAWVVGANNAAFGAQAAYDELVPQFEALFEREGRDWSRFYDAVRRLAQLPKDDRHKALKETRGMEKKIA